MTVLAAVLLFVVVYSSIVIIRRLKQGDASALAYVEELQRSDQERRASLSKVNAAVATATERMESWNSTIGKRIVELQTLEGQTAGTHDRAGPPAPSSTAVVSVATVTSALVPPSPSGKKQVITTAPGRVPDDYSAAKFRSTLATVQEVRAPTKPLPGFFPKEPPLPIHFLIPTLGRPLGDTSAESVVATEDHDAALTVLLAVLTGWPEAQVERGTVSPVGTELEWEGLRGHLCTFCRERRNPLTKALLEHESTKALFRLGFPTTPKEHGIELNGTEYLVPTDDSRFEGSEKTLHQREDVALVARFPNPWFPAAKAFIVAGTKAYGTWGAAQYLRYNWDNLMEEVASPKSSEPIEQRDFACILRVSVQYGVESESDVDVPSIPVNQDPLTVVKLIPRSASASILGIADSQSAA